MTHSSIYLLQRAFEHATASAAALGLTALLIFVDTAHATTPRGVTPTVTIQLPTVDIEMLATDTGSRVAAAASGRVNG